MSKDIMIAPDNTEWELLDPVLDLRPLDSAELRRLMSFEPVEMFYGSPPCAHFAQALAKQDEVQP